MALFGEAQPVTLTGKKVSCSRPELIILEISRGKDIQKKENNNVLKKIRKQTE
jgi:hypothetical protein